MLFLLLPFIFNPFRYLLTSMLPLYLMWWPLIMEKYGHDYFMYHVTIVIMFYLTKEMVRELMLKFVGFDAISLMAGLGMVYILNQNRQSLFFGAVTPLISGLLYIVEPIFLIIETIIIMEMLRKFNKWIADLSNIRDEDSHDLSSWDPPLTRGSILARVVVILITIACYIGTYMIVRDSKTLLGVDDKQIPIQFNHAIALLVTLQVISFFATIYKEDGILSETACVALTAAVPIFIASWSYNSLKEAKSSSRSSSSPSPASSLDFGAGSSGRPDYVITSSEPIYVASTNGMPDFGLLFSDHMAFAYRQGLDNPGSLVWRTLELLVGLFKIILDFMPKSNNNYLQTEFWYILLGRLVCLSLWTLFMSLSSSSSSSSSSATETTTTADTQSRPRNEHDQQGPLWKRLALVRGSSLLFKVLLILTYAQMIIQVTENNKLNENQLAYFPAAPSESACCGSGGVGALAGLGGLGGDQQALGSHQEGSRLGTWLDCMWTSAKLCSGGSTDRENRPGWLAQLVGLFAWLLGATLDALRLVADRLVGLLSLSSYSLAFVWLARWRSPIIQRLSQSILIQVYYIFELIFVRDHQVDRFD